MALSAANEFLLWELNTFRARWATRLPIIIEKRFWKLHGAWTLLPASTHGERRHLDLRFRRNLGGGDHERRTRNGDKFTLTPLFVHNGLN
jgi:hypothetical protein